MVRYTLAVMVMVFLSSGIVSCGEEVVVGKLVSADQAAIESLSGSVTLPAGLNPTNYELDDTIRPEQIEGGTIKGGELHATGDQVSFTVTLPPSLRQARPGYTADELQVGALLVNSSQEWLFTVFAVQGETVAFRGPMALPVGTNFFCAMVRLKDGMPVVRSVFFKAIRKASADTGTPEAVLADKAALTIAFGGSDATNSVTTNLTLATSGANGTTITWTATCADSGKDASATVSASGVVVRPVDADIRVILTATITKDGISSSKTFLITVLKTGSGGPSPSTNAQLAALSVSKGYLQPAFAAGATDYLAAPIPFSDSATPAYNDTQSVAVTATVADSKATITINGTPAVSGAARTLNNLAAGPNTVTIVVTAEDGTTTKTYQVVAYRALPVFKTGAGEMSEYTLDSREDGTTQRGVSWPNPRFTDHGNGTITDNMTGLMWLKDASSAGTTNTWMEALDHVAGLTAGGYTDWRLPNAREMLSLVNFGVAGQKAWLESQGFANVQVGPLDFYWTGTTYTYLSTHAWYMDWTVGTLAPDRLKSDSLHVWAVRSQAACLPATDAGEITGYALDPREDGATRKGIALPSPRFRDNGNGTLTDNMTGLIWLQNANHANAGLQWLAALDYLQNTINGGGGTAGSADWLLPNVNELGSLFLCSQVHMYTWLAGQGFSNVPIGDIINFWSATTRNPAYHSAWFVRLSWVAVTPDSKGYSMFVWPVRRN